MTKSHDDKTREMFRVEFAKLRNEGHPIVIASKRVGISPSTYYAWNIDDAWQMKGGWSKGGYSKGGGSKGGW